MLPHSHIPATVLLLAGIFAAPAVLHAETYNTCAGFIDTLPVTITTQGVWCVRHDLSTSITSGNAITINTNNVTIDCNNFKLGGLAAGVGTSARGIYADDRVNLTVRHCNVRGFRVGIYATGSGFQHEKGYGHVIEDNRLDGNTEIGIDIVGYASVVRRNQVLNTGGSSVAVAGPVAITTREAVDIIDNTIDGVFAPDGSGFGVTGIHAIAEGDRIAVAGNRLGALWRDGGGQVNGIRVAGTGLRTITNNVVDLATFAASSYGVRCQYSGGQFAKDNFISGFANKIQTCTDAGGNVL